MPKVLEHERYRVEPGGKTLSKIRKEKVIEKRTELVDGKVKVVEHAIATDKDIVVEEFELIEQSDAGYQVTRNSGDPSQPRSVLFISKEFVES